MAVEVKVEDGTGLADSTTYLSVADADAYFDARPRSDEWENLDADVKARLLVHSTRIIDAAMEWLGEPLKDTQALAFPRVDGDDEETGVPAALKAALCEMALALNAADVTAEPGMSGIAALSVGPIQITADKQSPEPTIPRFVADLLAPFGTPRASSASVRLMRR